MECPITKHATEPYWKLSLIYKLTTVTLQCLVHGKVTGCSQTFDLGIFANLGLQLQYFEQPILTPTGNVALVTVPCHTAKSGVVGNCYLYAYKFQNSPDYVNSRSAIISLFKSLIMILMFRSSIHIFSATCNALLTFDMTR